MMLNHKHFSSWSRCANAATVILVIALHFAATSYVSAATYTNFAAFQAATSGLTTDDFESGPWAIPGSKPIPTVNLGVSWSAQNELYVTTVIALSGSHSISDIDGNGDRDQLLAALPAGTYAAGGWIHGFLQGTATSMLAYDANNVLLESLSIPDTGVGFAFMGVTSSQAINRVEFRKPPTDGPNDDFVLDDFTFGNVVPEPASAVLLGFAALGMLALRNPRKPT